MNGKIAAIYSDQKGDSTQNLPATGGAAKCKVTQKSHRYMSVGFLLPDV